MARVLIAVDETAGSAHAARAAHDLFADAEFLVLNVARHAVPWMTLGPFGAVSVPEPGWLEEPVQSEDEVEDIAEAAGIDDAEVITDVGDPADRIVAAATEHSVDVIVVGDSHRGFLSRILEPSVSAAVLREARIPVLVVPSGDDD